MKAVILAGGEGNRLRPLTCDIPKPMVPIINIPIMEHIIILLRTQGIFEIVVTLRYLSQKIIDYFGDGSRLGVKLFYFTEDMPLGTAGSIKEAQHLLDEKFLVISGDALTDINILDAINFHKIKNSKVTIILSRVEVPLQYGVVVTDEYDRVIDFVEKPAWREVISDTVNTGIYILEPEVLNFIEKGIPLDFSRNLFPMLLNMNYEIFGYITDEYWSDIGDINSYIGAHNDFLLKKIKLTTNLNEIAAGVWVGNDVKIHDNAIIIAPCLIGNNCSLSSGNKIEAMTVIGNNNVFEEDVSIKRSIIWNNNYFERASSIRGAVICNRVNVKKQSSVYEESVIGDNCTIGDKAVVKPKVKVWPHKNIESLSIIDRSVIWNRKNIKSIFMESGVSGIINVDINPEFSTRLGAAYGSVLKKGSKILVSSTTDNSPRMFKHAFISGLLSVGIEVYNLSSLLTPVSRHAIKYLALDGGIHTKLQNGNLNKIQIDFMDSKGVIICKTMERKIEDNFFREDFNRASGEQISKLNNITDYQEHYLRDILARIDLESIKNARLKVLLVSPSDFIQSIVVPMLVEIGCMVSSQIYHERDSFDFKTKIKESEADFGAFIDANAENLNIILKDGRIIKDDMFTSLTSLIIFKKFKNPKVVVPITAPSVIEKMAQTFGGKVIRTKSSKQAVMERILNSKSIDDNELMSLFLLNFDAIAGLLLIMEFLTLEKCNISDVLNQIPCYFVSKKKIFCPWELKGKVMKTLITSEKDDKIELLDGIKIFRQDGWVFVLPDSELPLCRVYSEALDVESAEINSGKYLKMIRNIINN